VLDRDEQSRPARRRQPRGSGILLRHDPSGADDVSMLRVPRIHRELPAVPDRPALGGEAGESPLEAVALVLDDDERGHGRLGRYEGGRLDASARVKLAHGRFDLRVDGRLRHSEAAAASALFRPSATRRSTSRPRSVSWPVPLRRGVARGRPASRRERRIRPRSGTRPCRSARPSDGQKASACAGKVPRTPRGFTGSPVAAKLIVEISPAHPRAA
jgi:hypothetical protein